MKVREAMTRDVRLVKPDQPISEAARLMGELDIGALPVEDNDRLVGMITDRDIAVRAVAAIAIPSMFGPLVGLGVGLSWIVYLITAGAAAFRPLANAAELPRPG